MDYSNGYPILGPSTSNGVIEHTSQNGAGPSTVPYLSPTSQQRVVNGSGAPTLPMPFYFSPPGASGFNGQPVSGMANGGILSTSSSSPAKAIVIPGTEGRSVMRPDPKASGAEIVAYLMTFNIQTTEAEIEFSSKALESLHKKIKDKPKEMETFMRCVETKGEEVGGCVTVTRTLDGRLQVAGAKGFPHVIYKKIFPILVVDQVAGAKGFPHVIYNKIFRFQQIHKNELRSIPSCRYGFENKSEDEKAKKRHENGQRATNGYLFHAMAERRPNEDLLSDAQVCVNPYHYERPAPAPPATSAPLWDPLTGQMRINGMPIGDEPMDTSHRAPPSNLDSTSPRKREQRKMSGPGRYALRSGDDDIIITISDSDSEQTTNHEAAQINRRLSSSHQERMAQPLSICIPSSSSAEQEPMNIDDATSQQDPAEVEKIRKRKEAALELQLLREDPKAHLKHRTKLKMLDWSLQQIVLMMERVAKREDVTTTQYMLCCQHYAGMLSSATAGAPLDASQKMLVDTAVSKVKKMGGGGDNLHLRLDHWNVAKMFSNHMMTTPQRRELQEKKKRERAMDELAPGWTIDLQAELDDIASNSDAGSPFSKEQVQRAIEVRRKIIRREHITPDKPISTLEEARKRKADVAALEGPFIDAMQDLPIPDDLRELFLAPSKYLKTFQDAVKSEDDSTVIPPCESCTNTESSDDAASAHANEVAACFPSKKKCRCPEEARKKRHIFGKDDTYLPGVYRELVDAAFLLHRYRVKSKMSEETKGELERLAAGLQKSTEEIEPPSAKSNPLGYKWATLNYCERGNHVGEQKQVTLSTFFIDGGSDTENEQRLSLGAAIHPVTRFDRQVLEVKEMIGAGIRLSLKEDGSMWLRVLSRYPVFISSTYLDREAGMISGDAVHKIYPGTALKVFDLIRTRQAIMQLFEYRAEAAKLKAEKKKKKREGAANPLDSFNRQELRAISRIGAADLYRHAVVKISFCKGWGPELEYGRIQETPCWTEIILNRACELIDHVMGMLGDSDGGSDDESECEDAVKRTELE